MRGRFARAVDRFGTTVSVTGPDGLTRPLRAFLQPVLRDREASPALVTPLGSVSRCRWRCFTSGDSPLRVGDRVRTGDLVLFVQESRQILWGDTPLCCRAVLRSRREASA